MRENLRKARENRDMTQKDAADAIGLSVVGYRQIEYGKRIGSIDTWDKLEDFFGINQRELRKMQ